MFVLNVPDELAVTLDRIARRISDPGRPAATRSDAVAAAIALAQETGGVPALKLAFLRASVDAAAARHERRRLGAAGAETMAHGKGSAASVHRNGWRHLSEDEQRDRVDECIRCIRLDPDVSLNALAARVRTTPKLLEQRLAKRGFRRDQYGTWPLTG